MGPGPSGGKRRKPAAARREQARRAEGLMIQGFLTAIESLSEHRGSQPTRFGSALAALLKDENRLPMGRPLSGVPGPVPRAGAEADTVSEQLKVQDAVTANEKN